MIPKFNPPCCRECNKYTKQVCFERDGKCKKFEAWFCEVKFWSQFRKEMEKMICKRC